MTAFRVPRGWVEPDWDAIPPGFARHVHHEALVEYCTSFRERANYIKLNKPRGEVRRRLYLLGPIPPELVPKPLMAALAEHDAALAEHDAAQAEYDAAQAEYSAAWVKSAAAGSEKYDAARVKYADARTKFADAWAEIDDACAKYDWRALHAATCVPDCPWDGESIFPRPAKP